MRITVDEFKAAFALFEAEMIDTMNTSLQKFIVGAALAASGDKVDQMLAPFIKEDGTVDIDQIKFIIESGMRQSGGKVEIPINFGLLSAIGANPITTTITKFDIDKFFKDTIPSIVNSKK